VATGATQAEAEKIPAAARHPKNIDGRMVATPTQAPNLTQRQMVMQAGSTNNYG